MGGVVAMARNEAKADSIGAVVQAESIGTVILPGSGRPLPRQLPLAPSVFVGRATELAALDEVAGLVTVGGVGGVGKTSLVLWWAHEHIDRFPDGQLHVDLHGFDPGCAQVMPQAVVRSFLDALGVEPPRM